MGQMLLTLIAGVAAVLAPSLPPRNIHGTARSGDLQAVKSLLAENPKLTDAADDRIIGPLRSERLREPRPVKADLAGMDSLPAI